MPTFLLVIAALLLLWSATLYLRLPAPLGFMLLIPRLMAGALSPLLAGAGLLVTLASALVGPGAWPAAVVAGVAALAAGIAAGRIRTTRPAVSPALGEGWAERVQLPAHRLTSRWRLGLPAAGAPRFRQDVAFATVPGTDRSLLCDLWEPPAGVPRSRLAFLYFHGSAWYVLDKDYGTRPLFRHLTAQGHVVMDVAYRLFPETDVPGMAHDVKRTVAWMKEHASELGVDPDRIVLAGSSAGGHLSQLCGYAPHHPALTPPELQGRDLTVAGVVSCYGPSDMGVTFLHTNQQRLKPDTPQPDWQKPPTRLQRLLMGKRCEQLRLHQTAVAGRLDWLMGGTPAEVPERYALVSPVNHVHPGCPPTLLMQGEDDLITANTATRDLFARLRDAGVPAASLHLPHTDHGFDLVLMGCSPAAQRALYELERFLALVAAPRQA